MIILYVIAKVYCKHWEGKISSMSHLILVAKFTRTRVKIEIIHVFGLNLKLLKCVDYLTGWAY